MGKRKLVPLMPILVRLGACEDARAWVAKANCTTFREAWESCPDGEWMSWLLRRTEWDGAGLNFRRREDEIFWADRLEAATYVSTRYGTAYRADLRREFPAAEVERALYDYAVREGLA